MESKTIKVNDKLIERIEDSWIEMVDRLKLKNTTIKYKEAMTNYFIGAMQVLNFVVPAWGMCIQSGRDIGEFIIERQKKFRDSLLIDAEKLERHSHAPELNTLHFLSGKSIKTPHCVSVEGQ